MSIATVITEGFGSFGSISAIILDGYTAGVATTTVDTHDLPFTKDELKKLRAAEKRLAKRHEEKRLEALKLRQQIDEARGIYAPPDEPLADEPTLGEIKNEVTGTLYVDKMPELLAQLAQVSHQIEKIKSEHQAILKQYRRQKDERDMKVILHALSLH